MPNASPAPIGIQLTRTARAVSRALDEALAEAGGSLPAWLVLLNLKTNPVANQRELAQAVGVSEATLTHHLNAMERDGLLARHRDPHNRRIHVVELSPGGEDLFRDLRSAASAFDRRLRKGLSEARLEALAGALGDLAGNVGADDEAGWADATPEPARKAPATRKTAARKTTTRKAPARKAPAAKKTAAAKAPAKKATPARKSAAAKKTTAAKKAPAARKTQKKATGARKAARRS